MHNVGVVGNHSHSREADRALHGATVLDAMADECLVYGNGREYVARYAAPFGSKSGTVAPGHLVAIHVTQSESSLVLWRWYDALVIRDGPDGTVEMWEPAHGTVTAVRRQVGTELRPGGRAYLSAGLAGAPWWVNDMVTSSPEDANVEFGEVVAFYDEHELWSQVH